MRRKTINGNLFAKMVINGTNNLKNNSNRIDDLNVFPVPDGDTGTNMSMTMLTGAGEITSFKSGSISEVAKKLSRGLLMGARGNSGVILSQIFRGIAQGFDETDKASADDLVRAFEAGVVASYKAVMEPIEGTILTVSREATEALKETYNSDMFIDEIFDIYIKAAHKSLENTPNLLPILKEAGVVDSGGAGYILVLEGMRDALEGKVISLNKEEDSQKANISPAGEEFNIEFPFCTEFIVELKNENLELDEKNVAKELEKLGDSIVCVKDYDILKVHLHTKKPGEALNLGQTYGELIKMKIENMQVQHDQIANTSSAQEDMVELVQKKERTEYGIIAVVSGDELKEAFKEVGCHLIIDGGQTMNPPTEDFLKAIEEVNADKVIIVPNNSNVRLSAQQAAELAEGAEVKVLPAKTIAQGYASLIMFDPSSDLEVNIETMEETIKNVKTGEVTYAVRDTEMNGVEVRKDDFLGIVNGKIVASEKDMMDVTKTIIDSMIDDESGIITLFVGQDATEEQVEELESYLGENHSGVEVEVIRGNQEIYYFIIGVE